MTLGAGTHAGGQNQCASRTLRCYSTFSVTVPLAVAVPEVPVTVMMYVPGVVGEIIKPQFFALPQPETPADKPTARSVSASHAPQRRRRGTAMSKITARAAPPGTAHGVLRSPALLNSQPTPAVVAMVNVAVPALKPVMFTGVVEPKLNVGAFTAPLGSEVSAAVSATLPVNPPVGVTVMVDVFPVVAPAATVTGVPVIVKPGATPVPVSVNFCGEPHASSLTFSVALKLRADDGVKVT